MDTIAIGESRTYGLRANLKNGAVRAADAPTASSSDDAIAKGEIVDGDLVVTAVGPGHAKITVEAEGLATFVKVEVPDPDAEKAVGLSLVERAAARMTPLDASEGAEQPAA